MTCEECGRARWRVYIRYASGKFGWLCKGHYMQWVSEGFLFPV
jgi:hypothetical protein